MHPEPAAVPGHGLQCPDHGTGGGAAGAAEPRSDQGVEVVDEHDEARQGRGARVRRPCGDRAQPERAAGRGVQVAPALGTGRRTLAHDAPGLLLLSLFRVPGVPGGEVQRAEQLGAALQLTAEGLRELPHPDRVGGDEVREDVRQLRTGEQPRC
ncbi:hypothetical protein Smic_28730 [Streptomyces microflavus]|uniref:Uncharacterized protein n=1 Tax=Streptomyces microflavus TaxID=1919 RepID=A0A7J0CRG5_STRMI|nr:hypothetical protein Smic_28730 [Streptomyces microflavus]